MDQSLEIEVLKKIVQDLNAEVEELRTRVGNLERQGALFKPLQPAPMPSPYPVYPQQPWVPGTIPYPTWSPRPGYTIICESPKSFLASNTARGSNNENA